MSIGHNSTDGKKLTAFVERIEAVEKERAELAEDVKTILDEARGAGLDKKTIRRLLRERKKDPDKKREEDELFELYWISIGGK